MKLAIKEIIEATKGKLIKGDSQDMVYGISTDSRRIKSNELFIPLIGENFNGHNFIEMAVKSGANTVLISQDCEGELLGYKGLCIIKVKDTLKALQDLAKYYISKFHIPIIGVTGSTGKTSTKEVIYSVLSKQYNVLKNKGNLNNHIGLPLTVFELEKNHEIAILEMGMSGFGEINLLADIVNPDVAVITNIGLSHIEHLGSQENILKAKMEITNYFNEKNTLIVNGDDKLLKTLQSTPMDYEQCFVGLEKNCHYQAIHIKDLGEEGIHFDVEINDQIYPFTLKVPGEHNIYNALCAIAIGLKFNMDVASIQEGIKDFEGSKMRLHIFTTNEKIKVINDAYNASPDSMRAAINVLSKMQNRKIAVLGDMLEMGEYAKVGHNDVGCEVAKNSIDMLIVVGTDAEHIAKGAIENHFDEEKVYICKNNEEAIGILKNILQKEDIVLIKGSRGMRMEEIVRYIQERS
ncbi:UDP-N-acetylmuramoyl-tripeptide--D-alanyl-D-alanine ligase [Crassaminicella profunda]|uniref:UDP-N-acetylmuramoyl-tripeptide--D-alanyl-D- alanine ligase n=1 Tax=Crassaminicella profunda TaxID=1286698 RepID=UPI001CA76695|nr:UDP-N-acetylmuramoyl-tripeptide--D-alanyl-D-alanine ligase [Crassaminicella profunda]QZY57186.1 UDP-N-acetylmuramoyl-tripeptide--D-alanyl-D-alanine ligase [Crassaminicella profunda]